MAALLTRISIPPSSETTLAAIASTEALSETSASSAMQRPPSEDASCATRSAFSRDWSTAATAAPEAVSLAQMPSARPPPPPVTTATWPSRDPVTRRTTLAPSTENGAAVEGSLQQTPPTHPHPATMIHEAAEPQQCSACPSAAPADTRYTESA